MTRRMAIATSLLVIGGLTLSACGLVGSSSNASSSPTSAASAAPTTPTETTPTTPTAADLVGDWHSDAAQWTVHLKKDGTFVEDFQGLKDFRTGTYTVDGDTVSLVGGDGDTDKGTINGEVLDFKLGELTRDSAS